MPTLTARTLITPIGTVAFPAIEIDQAGLITDISTDAGVRAESILAPPFFDIHIHGAAGEDVSLATPAAFSTLQRFLARRGTAHYLPTTVTDTLDHTLAILDRLAQHLSRPTPPDEAVPLGIHLEGPFLSCARRGVHPAELLLPPSIETFDRFQQAAQGRIVLVTLAPELPGALDLVRHLKAQGVRVSMGHTDATLPEAEAAIRAGATSATHTFNAMRALDHRAPGVLGAVLDTPALYAELIADGIHVHPALVRMWLRAKGDRAILVTDGISATGQPDGDYTLGSLAVTVQTAPGADTARCTLAGTETLAGSVLTLDRAVRNLIEFTGCPLEQAVRAASANPAAMLGVALPTPQPGQPANFNQFTERGVFTAAYRLGRRIT